MKKQRKIESTDEKEGLSTTCLKSTLLLISEEQYVLVFIDAAVTYSTGKKQPSLLTAWAFYTYAGPMLKELKNIFQWGPAKTV